jgi:organic radical activating enzyme
MPHCNLRCSWCDTSFDSHKATSVEDFLAFAKQEECRFAVVTGGEPTMNRHTPKVVELLQGIGFTVACETNGTFESNAPFDWITCSPKRDAEYLIHPKLMNQVGEFKYVVDKGFDFTVLDRHNSTYNKTGSLPVLSLSPEFTDFKENVAAIVEYIKKNPHWRLSLQTHKWIGLP